MLTERLREILDHFPQLTVALVGDLFLDRYLEIEPGAHELSLETGLEAYQVRSVRNAPGALGTVLNNLAALGVGQLRPVTVVGDDGHAYDLMRELERLPVEASCVLKDPQRLTPTYTKPLRRDQHGAAAELNRLDIRSRVPLSAPTNDRLAELLRTAFAESDGLIVLDQIEEPNCGVVNQRVKSVLAELARTDPKKLIFIDSRAHLGDFTCGVLKCNRAELLAAVGCPDESQESTKNAACRLAQRTGNSVYVTLGPDGILIAEPSGEVQLSPGREVSGPIDIVGAGDSATSGMVASLLSGANQAEAATVGNLAASITIRQLGCTGTASPDQLLAEC